MNENKKKRRWFSKWGIVVIICVLLIGYTLIPSVGVYVSQPPNPAQMHISQIAKTYVAYINSGSSPRMLEAKPGYTAHMAAYFLAKETQLNNASLYFIKDDPLAPKEIPKVIMFDLVAGDTMPKINPDFMESTLSFEIAANVSANAPSTTTPIVWDRGLQENGTWSADSPRKGQGGYIAYFDGHVEWYDKLSLDPQSGPLVKYGTNIPTVNIREALPPGAVILSAEPNGRAGPPDPPSQK